MTNADVIELAGLGFSDDVIIEKIYASKATDFDTSVSSLKALKAAKVSDGVIRVMISPQGPNMAGQGMSTEPPAVSQQAPAAPAVPPNGPGAPAAPVGPPVYFHSDDGKMRIYVTDHPISEFISVGRASSSTYANANHLSSNSSAANVAHAQSGDDPRTVEIQADVQKLCPPYVIVSNNPDRADYILVFRREGGKRTTAFAFGGLAGLAIAAGAKVDGSSLFLLNGDMVFATKENTVQKAIKYTCEHIPPPVAAPAVTPTP
jgi:hypothetical protein